MSVTILADDNPHWRPTSYERYTRYNRLLFEFATIKLLDYRDQQEMLTQHENPFAIIILTHPAALEVRQNTSQRLCSKLAVTRALYRHGFSKDYVLNLLSFIDWVLALPEPLELEYTY